MLKYIKGIRLKEELYFSLIKPFLIYKVHGCKQRCVKYVCFIVDSSTINNKIDYALVCQSVIGSSTLITLKLFFLNWRLMQLSKMVIKKDLKYCFVITIGTFEMCLSAVFSHLRFIYTPEC